MELSYFIYIGFFLVLTLAVLLALFFKNKKTKKAILKVSSREVLKQDFNSLTLVLEDKQSNTQELKNTLDLILRDYGEIHDFSIYEEILLRITLHPNTNKNIILNFDKELSKLNPSYKKKISKAVTDALKSRGT